MMMPGLFIGETKLPALRDPVHLHVDNTIDLCEFLLHRLQGKVSQDSLDVFDVMYISGSCDIQFFTAEEYPKVCQAIMQACDELERLKPYKAELKAALEADPRFKQAA